MNLPFEIFKDIRNSGTVLKHRDMSGCIVYTYSKVSE